MSKIGWWEIKRELRLLWKYNKKDIKVMVLVILLFVFFGIVIFESWIWLNKLS